MIAPPMTDGPKFADVYAFGPLLRAFRRARRAKRGRGGEPAFYRHLERRLLALSEALRERSWRPDPYRYFRLWTGKERLVSEASFRDRVVHHALVGALEPCFEACFLDQSYACRKGRGLHAAVRRAQILARRHRYFLRLDVLHYFDHVDHSVLLALLARRAADPGVLWLCETILGGSALPTVPAGVARGIPIGNLTSQFWANVYLDPLDHLLEAQVGPGQVLRYMDDVLVFGDDKTDLWAQAAAARSLLADELHLALKERITRVAPVTEGVPWLGFSVFPGTIRLGRRARRRLGQRLRTSTRRAARTGEAGEAPRAASAVGHARTADSLMLRRQMLRSLENRA